MPSVNIGFRLVLPIYEEILVILVLLWVEMSFLIHFRYFLVILRKDRRFSLFFLSSLHPFFLQSFLFLLFYLRLSILNHFLFLINHYFRSFSIVFLLLQKDIFHFFKIDHHDQKPADKRHK